MAQSAFDRLLSRLDWSEQELRAQLGSPPLEAIPQNIQVGSLRRFYPIPTFDRDLAAGHWTEAIGVGPDEMSLSPEQVEQGLFRVRLSGDSMRPAYKDGEVVEFHLLRLDCGGIVDGADYYIQRGDHLATFKRAWCDDDGLRLRAINRRKYKDEWRVAWTDVARVARAVGKFQSIDQ